MFEVTVEETFAAGHALRNYKGKCENVHGHNYRIQVVLTGEQLDPAGLLYDFVELRRHLGEVIGTLDHQFLNDLPAFKDVNPSAENIARYFYEQLSTRLRTAAQGPLLRQVTVFESDTTAATYRP